MFGLTDTVRLRSKVGPLHLRVRVQDPDKGYMVRSYDWTFENDFRCEVDRSWWEEVRDGYIDKPKDLTYQRALQPI